MYQIQKNGKNQDARKRPRDFETKICKLRLFHLGIEKISQKNSRVEINRRSPLIVERDNVFNSAFKRFCIQN